MSFLMPRVRSRARSLKTIARSMTNAEADVGSIDSMLCAEGEGEDGRGGGVGVASLFPKRDANGFEMRPVG